MTWYRVVGTKYSFLLSYPSPFVLIWGRQTLHSFHTLITGEWKTAQCLQAGNSTGGQGESRAHVLMPTESPLTGATPRCDHTRLTSKSEVFMKNSNNFFFFFWSWERANQRIVLFKSIFYRSIVESQDSRFWHQKVSKQQNPELVLSK